MCTADSLFMMSTEGKSPEDSPKHCHVHAAGKTTLLRDVTGLLAERFGKRVVVVDTSNEIGGDGKVPHKCIGRARRMPVPHKSRQHEVLQEAVQNHNPQVCLSPLPKRERGLLICYRLGFQVFVQSCNAFDNM